MNKNCRSVCAVFVLAGFFASSASAADWYVDAVGGSDANSGTSPSSAWKTTTHAVAATPQVGATTIHVAPGTYDAALGEAFPWTWRPALSLLGDQGYAVTHVVGAAGIPVIAMESLSASQSPAIGPDTLVAGLGFQSGTSAIVLRSDWGRVSPTLRDLAITGTTSAGIAIDTFPNWGEAKPALEHVAILNCAVGLSVSANGYSGTTVRATDCTISGSTGCGITILAEESAGVLLERCRIEHSGSWGLQILGGPGGVGHVQNSLHATTIAHNVGGIWGASGVHSFQSQTIVTRCTIADNGSVGVRMDGFGPAAALLNSTIIHGHADDLAISNSPSTVNYCEIGDGEYAGSQGNFQADPLFVNAAAGDYHLLAGSPCIDAGDPAFPLEANGSVVDVGAHTYVPPSLHIYCAAKLNSCGILTSIGSSGTQSTAAASGYVISTSGAKGLKPGLLLYSTSGRANMPFDGGVLCVAAPVRRSTLLVDTSGSAGLCNGVLKLDMNAFTWGALGGTPAPGLRIPGTRVDCQFWGRDSPGRSLLSNALEYFVAY